MQTFSSPTSGDTTERKRERERHIEGERERERENKQMDKKRMRERKGETADPPAKNMSRMTGGDHPPS